jgi:putative ABC transport system permease protein
VILHLLKVVWHRKRANALILAEIFLSFIVVFAVATIAVSLISRWRTPLGFDWHHVWVIDFDNAPRVSGTQTVTLAEPPKPQPMDNIARVVTELKAFPEVETAAIDSMPPYAERTWGSAMSPNGREVIITRDLASDDFATAMRIPILAGRWFSRDDEGAQVQPLVIDADSARAMFGTTDIIGKQFAAWDGEKDQTRFRVIGVIPPFRKDGEFTAPNLRMVFSRASLVQMPGSVVQPNQIIVRLHSGITGDFEPELARRLHAMFPDARFRIQRMDQMRATALKMRLVPITALALVAVFLIAMVALGLTGVLWQTVTRRMREIGIRRALGASGSGVRLQVLGEVALLATLAVAIGAIVLFQLPLIGFLGVVTAGEFSSGFIAALAVIYAITLLCGAYPSWLASSIDPAEALRYE